MKITCPKCGEIINIASFCGRCGVAIPDYKEAQAAEDAFNDMPESLAEIRAS